ncbi:MAG: phasin family protein [Xanthobacteraceae bacterium]
MFDLFSANAAAVLDFATALGQAKSLTDAIELHSRFANERYSTLLRQTNEIAELTRRSTFAATAPVRLSIGAFVT